MSTRPIKYQKVCVISLLLITDLLMGKPVAKAQSDVPFLYYYSQSRSAFIVERADGSDSRVLAPFALPDGYTIIGPGWSPSGRWFAWTLFDIVGGAGYPEARAWIVSRDGKYQVALSAGSGSIASMSWSPSGDLLLIKKYILLVQDMAQYIKMEYEIYNPEGGMIILPTTVPIAGDLYSSFMEWTPSGRYVAIYYQLPADGHYMMELFAPDGTPIIERLYYSNSTCFVSRPGHGVFWSNDTAVYLSSDGKTVNAENLANRTMQQLPAPSGVIAAIDWSPNGNYALIYMQSSCYAETAQLWLLSLTARTIMRVSQDVRPRFPCCGDDLLPSELGNRWSPAGNKAFFVSADGQLYLVTPAPFVMDKLNMPQLGTLPLDSPIRWDPNGDKLTFLWNLASETYKSQIYAFNPKSMTGAAVLPQTDAGIFSFSSSERYVVLEGVCGGACIVDLTFGKSYKLELKFPDRIPPTSAMEFIWHPGQDWVLAMGITISPFYWINVVNADVSVQREIGECYIFAQSCFGWLPESETF